MGSWQEAVENIFLLPFLTTHFFEFQPLFQAAYSCLSTGPYCKPIAEVEQLSVFCQLSNWLCSEITLPWLTSGTACHFVRRGTKGTMDYQHEENSTPLLISACPQGPLPSKGLICQGPPSSPTLLVSS